MLVELVVGWARLFESDSLNFVLKLPCSPQPVGKQSCLNYSSRMGKVV